MLGLGTTPVHPRRNRHRLTPQAAPGSPRNLLRANGTRQRRSCTRSFRVVSSTSLSRSASTAETSARRSRRPSKPPHVAWRLVPYIPLHYPDAPSRGSLEARISTCENTRLCEVERLICVGARSRRESRQARSVRQHMTQLKVNASLLWVGVLHTKSISSGSPSDRPHQKTKDSAR